jgi:hypothetical protein
VNAVETDWRDELADWISNIVAPRLAYAVVCGDHHQAEDELAPLNHQQLLGLAVVLAGRCTLLPRDDGTLADQIATVLTDAVHYRQPVDQLAHLPVGQLLDVIRILAARCARPRTRPEDGQVDEVAVHRAAKGEAVLLTHTERTLAIHLMDSRGVSHSQIMRQFLLNGRQVLEILARPVQLTLWELA